MGIQVLAPVLVLVAVMGMTGCRVPPSAADPSLPTRPVNQRLLTAPVIHVHVATIGEHAVPAEALEASMATLRRHIQRPIELVVHPPIAAPEMPSPHMEPAAQFPVLEDGRPLTIEDLKSGDPKSELARVHRLRQPDRGIVGLVGFPTATDEQGRAAWYTLKPMVEPGVIAVLAVPGTANGLGNTGYATQVVDDRSLELRTGLVVLRAAAIRRRAGVFVPEARLWEWTLTHEIGHVLGVPASNHHGCIVPGYGGIHCTRPECVMATGVSWRTIASGLINGWPLDYCGDCTSEIASAYGGEPPPREDGPEVSDGMGNR